MAPINRWNKTPDEVAARIDLAELDTDGALRSKAISIDQGCLGLLFEGQQVEVLQAGQHTLDTMLRAINRWGKRSGTLLLIDSVDQVLSLPAVTGRALDGGEVQVEVALAVDINDPLAFSQHVMGGQGSLQRADLAAMLQPSVARAALMTLPRQDTHAWVTRADGRDELATAIERNLVADFQRRGIRIARVDVLGLRSPEVESHQERLRSIRGKEAAAELDVLEANVDLDRDESLMASQLRRTRLLAQQRDLINDDTIDEATKAARLTESLAELEQSGAITSHQREQALLDLSAEGEQAAVGRQHAKTMLEQRHREELTQTRSAIDHRLHMQSLAQEREQALAAGDSRLTILDMELQLADKEQALALKQAEHQRREVVANKRAEVEARSIDDLAQFEHLQRLQQLEAATLTQEQDLQDRAAVRAREAATLAHQQQVEAARLDAERQIDLAKIEKGDVTQIEIARAQAAAAAAAAPAQAAAATAAQNQSVNQQMMAMVQQAMNTMGGIAQSQAQAMGAPKMVTAPPAYPPPPGYPPQYGYPPPQPPQQQPLSAQTPPPPPPTDDQGTG